MSPAVWVGCAALGAVGAIVRAETAAVMTRRHGLRFPWGTLAVNLAGAFAIGVLHGTGVGGRTAVLLGAGLLGSLTTFSTWMLESFRLLRSEPAAGLGNLGGSLAIGLSLVALGDLLGSALAG